MMSLHFTHVGSFAFTAGCETCELIVLLLVLVA